MESQAKRNIRNFRLPKIGSRRDRQVTPIEDGGRVPRPQEEVKVKDDKKPLQTASKQTTKEKRADREMNRQQKEEAQRIKVGERENRRIRRKQLRKLVRKDLAETSLETCATFCFVFVVGSVLFGGGTALIVSGREYNIFDFIVVGATGITVGVIFTASGIILLLKPLYEKHLKRKQASKGEILTWSNIETQQQQKEPNTVLYLDEQRKQILTSQIHDVKLQNREPSTVELYGREEHSEKPSAFDNVTTLTTPRDDSFHSQTSPPYLAIPNHEKDSFTNEPVLFLDTSKESHQFPEAETETEDNKRQNNHQKNASSSNASNSNLDPAHEPNSDSLTTSKSQTRHDERVDTNFLDDFHVDEGDHLNHNDSRGSETIEDYDEADKKVKNANLFKHVSKSTVVIEHSMSDSPSPEPEIRKTTSSSLEQRKKRVQESKRTKEDDTRVISFERHYSDIMVPVHDDSTSESPSPR